MRLPARLAGLRRGLALTVGALAAFAGPGLAANGGIAGRVTTPEGIGVAGVAVGSAELAPRAVSDADGRYTLAGLEPGVYDLDLRLGDLVASEVGVQVAADAFTEVSTVVDWDVVFGEVLTVRAASRYPQRIVEAPAAVTSVPREEIVRRSASGQIPRLLAGSAAAELAQGGLFDFNLNVRGFNGSTHRRVLTLLDGRDPSLAVFSGAQEWAALSFELDELESVELVHGPGAALYGAGAYNGVLDLRTRSARASLGGRVRVVGGELDTRRAEARWAGGSEGLGYVKLTGGYQESRDFLRSRVGGAEYRPAEMPPEVIAPPLDEVSLWGAGLRYDRDLGRGLSLTLDGGTGRIEGAGVVTGVGRLQRLAVERPWARLDLGAPHWSLLASYTGRDSDGEVSLATGGPIYLDSYRGAVEGQAHASFAEDRGRVIGGLSWTRLRVDSADPAGNGTIFPRPVESEHEAVFGQGEYSLTDRLMAVVSLRWDDSDLHEARWSPRGALVWALGPHQSLRLTYSEAFVSPTLSEKNVRVAVAPPLDLSGLEEALAPLLGGVSLGLDAVPLLAVGNPELEAEEVETWELGYRGAVGSRTFVSANVYRSDLSNFTTNLTPVLGTSLGQLIDPPLWRPPAALSPEVSAAVLAALAAALPPTFLVAAAEDGSAFVPLLSFGSFGEVETTGLEASVSTLLGRWRLEGGLSWFDYEIGTEAAEHPLAANRAEWQTAVAAGWAGERFDAALDWRWSDGFDYRSGIFVGPVPAYSVFDLATSYRLDEDWKIGLTVANLLDDEHWQAFGGDLLGRRALVHVAWEW